MNACDTSLLWPFTHLGTALFFLLLGWKLGRESTGRPMFDFPSVPPLSPDPGEECDPWSLAAGGQDDPGRRVDNNETPDRP